MTDDVRNVTCRPPQVHTTAAATGSAARMGAGTGPTSSSCGACRCSAGAPHASAAANSAVSACVLAKPNSTVCKKHLYKSVCCLTGGQRYALLGQAHSQEAIVCVYALKQLLCAATTTSKALQQP